MVRVTREVMCDHSVSSFQSTNKIDTLQYFDDRLEEGSNRRDIDQIVICAFMGVDETAYLRFLPRVFPRAASIPSSPGQLLASPSLTQNPSLSPILNNNNNNNHYPMNAEGVDQNEAKAKSVVITKCNDLQSWFCDLRGSRGREESVYSIDNSLNNKICLWRGDITKLKIGSSYISSVRIWWVVMVWRVLFTRRQDQLCSQNATHSMVANKARPREQAHICCHVNISCMLWDRNMILFMCNNRSSYCPVHIALLCEKQCCVEQELCVSVVSPLDC